VIWCFYPTGPRSYQIILTVCLLQLSWSGTFILSILIVFPGHGGGAQQNSAIDYGSVFFPPSFQHPLLSWAFLNDIVFDSVALATHPGVVCSQYSDAGFGSCRLPAAYIARLPARRS